jgi:outer membrane receptor protein involved in Fe transport
MKHFITSLLFTLVSILAIAQPPMGAPMGGRMGGGKNAPMGSFYGKVLEAKSQKPIEYASVQVLKSQFDTATKKKKEVVIAGQITKTNGEFRLENIPAFGQYKLKIEILGYKSIEQSVSFDIKPGGDMSNIMNELDKDLGNIKIEIADKTLDAVTVTATTPGLRLGIDRRVFGVDKNLVSAGGTAVDIMKNVPSISVDIDGNVTMRNNTPQIFVDGRPTNLTLDQIPADAVESVEIITNPSAKYDASGGTAGILNVVLKKNKRVGYSGNVRTSVDARGKIGFGGDINLRKDKINFFLNSNYNQRKSVSNGTTDRTTLISSPNTILHQTDKSTMNGNFKFFRTGVDIFADNRNTISLSLMAGGGHFSPYSSSDMLVDSILLVTAKSRSIRSNQMNGNYYHKGLNASFKHLFPKSGEELTADITYNKSNSFNFNSVSTDYLQWSTSALLRSFKQKQDGTGAGNNLTIQTDYTRPLTDKSKLETGLRAQFRSNNSINDIYQVLSNGYLYMPAISSNYNSDDRIFAAYATYTNQVKIFNYQFGLRAESSNYTATIPNAGQHFKINFPISLFPSLNIGKKLKADQDLQMNYSRKINRPNYFQLSPFTDYSDSLNLNRGNPALKPEFTNSFELSYQKTFKNKDNFIASVYYKNTNKLISRYQVKETDYNNNNVLINTFINANNSYVSGLELVSKNKIAKWWDLTSNLNLFTSKIKLADPSAANQNQFASYFIKANNTFKIVGNFTLQLSGEYQSKTVLPPGGSGGNSGGRGGGMFGGGGGGMWGQTSVSQGYSKSNYFVDAGIKYEFLKNKQASVSLNVNDIFKTRRTLIYSSSAYFTQEAFRRRDPQMFRLNFNWRFGKFDPNLFKRKNNKANQEGMDNGAGGMQ